MELVILSYLHQYYYKYHSFFRESCPNLHTLVRSFLDFVGILNVHDVTPDVAMLAWSVYHFAVVIDIRSVEAPNG